MAVRLTEAYSRDSREVPLHEVGLPKVPSIEAAISKVYKWYGGGLYTVWDNPAVLRASLSSSPFPHNCVHVQFTLYVPKAQGVEGFSQVTVIYCSFTSTTQFIGGGGAVDRNG